jgi:anti-sigma-K factor RskA
MTSADRSSGDRSRDEVLAGEYVLGVLSASDRQKVEARIVLDRNFAAIVQRWQENLASLDEEYEREQPPAWIYPRIEQRLHGGPAPAAAAPAAPRGLWQSLSFWRAVTALSLIAAAGIGLANLDWRGVNRGQELVASLSGEGSAVSYASSYDPKTGVFRMTPVAAGPEKEKSLELWLIQGDDPAVSLGVLPQTGEGELLVPAEWRGKIREGDLFAISLEAYGGSPTGKAQGPILAVGPAVQKN